MVRFDKDCVEIWSCGSITTITRPEDVQWIKDVLKKGKKMGLDGKQLEKYLEFEMDEECFLDEHPLTPDFCEEMCLGDYE